MPQRVQLEDGLMASRFLIFGDLRFDPATRELARVEAGGAAVPLPIGSRAADILLLFLQRPGDLVTKNEIMSAVWPNTVVEDSNLTVQISALRRALDAGREGASAISTVPGRGYRFTLPVQKDHTAGPSLAPAPPQDSSPVAIRTTSGDGSAPADAVAREASPPASSVDQSAHAKVPKWVPLGAAAALLVVAALALLWQSGHSPAMTAKQYFARGQSFVRIEAFDRAIADFSEAIRLDPSPAEAYLARAITRRYAGDYDGAIADTGKVIDISPTEHRAFLERGNDYLAKDDLDHAGLRTTARPSVSRLTRTNRISGAASPVPSAVIWRRPRPICNPPFGTPRSGGPPCSGWVSCSGAESSQVSSRLPPSDSA